MENKENNTIVGADKLANQAYKYSLGNIAIALYGFISGIPMFIVFSLAICALVFNKANKAKSEGSLLNKKINSAKIISSIILASGLILLIFILTSSRHSTSKSITTIPVSYSKQEVIHAYVETMGKQITFPVKIDELTNLTGIMEKTGSIGYDYTISNPSKIEISNTILKSFMIPTFCQDKITRSILDKDINFDYFYKVKDSIETYSFSITKSDCL